MRDVVRDVVGELAPHELILLDALLLVDDDTALRRLARGRHRDPLGFGLGEAATLLTPVVWMALDEAARQMVSATVASAGRRARPWLRRIRRRPAQPVQSRLLPPLTSEQLEAVRSRVAELAVESGLEREAAEALAERVVARLVLPVEPRLDDGTEPGPDDDAEPELNEDTEPEPDDAEPGPDYGAPHRATPANDGTSAGRARDRGDRGGRA
ncbi:hypothetical protein [Streptomyces sp. NPDC004658]|uniref:hypothetical protein n=1 Tax=Streptomyces sp. NPDC004658 TaxID=3154672 RepID=UPI0033B82EB1